jgi:serine/threonine protein kinase/tetratricopeptide (TPR) repeat protein
MDPSSSSSELPKATGSPSPQPPTEPAAEPNAGTIVLSLPVTEKPGDMIGRYKLLQQLGEGGCGVVYMAEQEEPVRRRVALKVIKLGMDTKSVIARFEAERQALAMMDHPNIAKVLDAGSTDAGRPFFVMELVRGIRITEYCDQNRLNTEERLKLFIQVCQAIQHAHQKGIIHRDIKPSNILVTLHDGVPVPKVIDFGIAKATQGRLTDQTLFTAFEQFIGTPAYMSPEQAEMSGLDVDTRSDIYALGVLLYELLTGKTPFDVKELLAAGLDKLRHTIREEEPERPSTKLQTMTGDDLTTTAKRRHTDAPRLIHLVRGDLDWIVMKTLEKDRTRRYETATGLALDVQRHLINEPVTARPPSNVYRLQKMVRRNALLVGAVAAVIVALAAGFGLSLFLFVRERAARQRAVAAEQEQARLRKEAERTLALSEKLSKAGRLLGEGQFDAAEQLVYETSPPHPASAPILNAVGLNHARRGEFRQAITNFLTMVDLVPTEHMPYFYLGPLLVQVGDLDGYNRNVERILVRFATNRTAMAAERVAKSCLVVPPPPERLAQIAEFANYALKNGKNVPMLAYFQFVEGLAFYRQGNYSQVIELIDKVIAQSGDDARTTQANMVKAMTQYHLGQKDLARETLEKGLEFANQNLPRPNARDQGMGWHDTLIARALMREARALITPEQK